VAPVLSLSLSVSLSLFLALSLYACVHSHIPKYFVEETPEPFKNQVCGSCWVFWFVLGRLDVYVWALELSSRVRTCLLGVKGCILRVSTCMVDVRPYWSREDGHTDERWTDGRTGGGQADKQTEGHCFARRVQLARSCSQPLAAQQPLQRASVQ
jgi:hypothetical protein